ncbi:hypothetical protein M3Y95_00186400 [Aphelenchoides besseyi]|nr:hypothetical protein M3Y95_00186400 [Aphelenchoides besseyi]
MSASRLFLSTRRKVQRRFLTVVLGCGFLLIAVYALIVLTTGAFVIYIQFNSATNRMSETVDVEVIRTSEFIRLKEKHEETDPIARLLRAVDGGGTEGLEDDQPNDEVQQIQEAAAIDSAFMEHRLPLNLEANHWKRFRHFRGGGRKKRSTLFEDIDLDRKVNSTVDATRKRRENLCSEEEIAETQQASNVFPTDLFSVEDRRRGAVLLHLFALCYIFLALAIVCDSFLVPSLMVITETLQISDDVAGSSFMAAAGSAPEAFTSLFGVFITSDNVGIGTIIGSAVFNIQLVLAFCAFFSHEVLHLTWWPMVRDISFYLLALFLLFLFFFDEKIDWYEALSLFLLYIVYCIFMRYNIRIEKAVKKQFSLWSATVAVDNTTLVQNDTTNTQHHPTIRDMPMLLQRTIPLLHSGAIFRNGIVQIALELPNTLAAVPDSECSSLPDENIYAKRSKPLFTKRLSHPVMRTGTPLLRVQKPTTPTPSSPSSRNESGAQMNDRLSPVSCTGSQSQVWSTVSSTSNIHQYSNSSPPHVQNGQIETNNETNNETKDDDQRNEQSMNLQWPSTFYKRCVFVFLAPICFPLYWTLPDVNKQEKRKHYLITFLGSVLWIAALSYLMVKRQHVNLNIIISKVWMAQVIGDTFSIPNEIMGLTFLAAGTSVPDLITSIIVARKGLGDMAVSSSIGSNLFDICVGLPIPWIFYYLVYGFSQKVRRISVKSKGLVCSVGILFMTLSLLYGTVAMIGWRMNKKFGCIMLGSYLLFCTLSVLLEVDILTCPIKEGGCA